MLLANKMPNRTRRNSVVDLLAKVPVNRGSLLKGIENLLKTIESSESAVMIPTLLRDKCDFDAWELLFVAKILKASILGHSDLVEFYMNHIGHSSNQFANQSSDQQQQQQQQPNHSTSTPSPSTTARSIVSPLASPATEAVGLHMSASPSTTGQVKSPLLSSNGQLTSEGAKSSPGNMAATGWITASQQSATSGISSGSFSSTNGVLPLDGMVDLSMSSSITSSSSSSSASSSSASSLSSSAGSSSITNQPDSATSADFTIQDSLLTARPPLARQAQPPSLLQLTTTNNHINSVAAVAAGFTNNSIEQLTNQLTAMQQGAGNGSLSQNGNGSSLDGALSISTSSANQQSQSSKSPAINGTGTGPVAQVPPAPELRSSRSAGCLYRINSSGASSPRTPTQTPTTPYPQAETLANGLANGLACDPSTPVKLLLQIEQLKASIGHVTNLLESVVELYKKSIDEIAG